MTKLIASLFALAIIAAALPAAADCPGHEQMTVQTSPVVTSDADGTAPMTPVPPTTTKTGG
jgi:hypothetical protein